LVGDRFPGRCPGLICCGPFGANRGGDQRGVSFSGQTDRREQPARDELAPPTEYVLDERDRRGDRARFEAILAKVKDRPPDPGDEL
jgi:hypothetical protein